MIEQDRLQQELYFKFRYQEDPEFQALIENGIGNELSDSGYCWAACLDMALSPNVPEQIRMQIIIDAVNDEKLAEGVFNQRGELNRQRLGDFVDVVNEYLSSQKLSPRLNLIKNQRFEDYHLELQKGRLVVYGMADESSGHMMIMDKVFQDGGKYIYSTWDPAIPNPTEANIYFDNFQLYGRQQYANVKLLPFIVSVGEEPK